MATLPGLRKDQVRDALLEWNSCHDKNPVPDFTKREKTNRVWSKVYVSIANDKVQFVELNPYSRFFWRLLGWYKDTVIEEATLQKVRTYVHEILSSPDDQYIAELKKQKKAAQTREDYINLMKTLEKSLEELPTADTELQNNIRLDLAELLAYVKICLASKVLEEFKEDYLPSKFLDNVLKFAKENPNSPQNELVWNSIEEALKLNPDEKKAELNVQLFRTLVNVLSGDPAADVKKGSADKPKEKVNLISIPCQEIDVPDEIARLVDEQIKAIECPLTPNPSSWEEYLQNHQSLVKANERLCVLRNEVKRLFLDEITNQAMVKQLYDKLVAAGGDETLVTAYVHDDKRIAERLYYHCVLAKDGAAMSSMSQDILRQITECQKAMRNKIENEFKRISNKGGGDCFFLSCGQLTDNTDWRSKIAAFLLENVAKYTEVVASRIETDDMAPKKGYEAYCAW
ncbi:MAG: hypothetical protein ABSA17_09195, partial [Rhabdochlamydiaceae bacterium]